MNILEHPHTLQWTILILSLLVLSYAAWKIKNEPDAYEQSNKFTSLGLYTLKIPPWWGESKKTKSYLQYERLDTYYEWAASFEHLDKNSEELNEETLNQIVSELKIEFDQGFEIERFQYDNITVIRHEGMGSENNIKRVYMDVAIVFNEKHNKYIRAISRSSVLNGCVEGPYFEKVLSNISLKSLS
ncbi:MAG: hypothetical protein CME61_03885 [Halobacteriovoraceae bacterium]|nr:hypothetical protein [Halobacteriovoraceae bacterium]|tara:strand:- start:101 stop:658 length:558 start_codon:yes stop_codon:yes gene_type:complete